MTKRSRLPRGSIDADMILGGAFKVAGRDGLDGLSMPGLASHLGVGVTSIYWYFKNKDELLRQMNILAVHSLQEQMLPVDGVAPAHWRSFLRSQAVRSREVYAQDAVLTDLMISRNSDYSRETTRFVFVEAEKTLRLLVEAGFKPADAWYVQSAISMFTRGVVITERTRRITGTPPEGPAQLQLLDTPAMPILTQLISEEPIIIDMTGDAAFLYGLDLILDAAEARLTSDAQ
ncbi:TetR/AcrR family transcriptional regulator C-terminal domain-containing protein [Pseudarthrobacter sp. lyk4-40-TYG-27]|uniref:TetR family transcriptional regulator n=1 Tax=Pseudarthrobacter sp. lyk4-40-TYG-27 TaxID=3040305 RepID=UPI002555136B|nr:TetR/AcrR family transcriptional regulator C-terminal domain-containing protein [Pseudarthrobacter sp. lyk4-40-TYG-27]